jgi:hypothetical protein
MKLSRPLRILAAFVTLFSLLFTQLAVAAYACPNWETAPVALSSDAASDVMPGCTGMDVQQPGLCKAHCDGNHQALDTPAAPNVAPFVASTLACIIPDAERTAPRLINNGDALSLEHATSPPIAIRNCCFRI